MRQCRPQGRRTGLARAPFDGESVALTLVEMEPGLGPLQVRLMESWASLGTLEAIESTNLARVIGRGPGGLHSNDLKALNLQILGKCLSSLQVYVSFWLAQLLGSERC